jgi:hypothetical protein
MSTPHQRSQGPPLSVFEEANWISDSPDNTCVETNLLTSGQWEGWIGVRDSKDGGQGPVLAFNAAEWEVALTAHARRARLL